MVPLKSAVCTGRWHLTTTINTNIVILKHYAHDVGVPLHTRDMKRCLTIAVDTVDVSVRHARQQHHNGVELTAPTSVDQRPEILQAISGL
jgi:hypothetical protein